jgi:hypothetical protein
MPVKNMGAHKSVRKNSTLDLAAGLPMRKTPVERAETFLPSFTSDDIDMIVIQ